MKALQSKPCCMKYLATFFSEMYNVWQRIAHTMWKSWPNQTKGLHGIRMSLLAWVTATHLLGSHEEDNQSVTPERSTACFQTLRLIVTKINHNQTELNAEKELCRLERSSVMVEFNKLPARLLFSVVFVSSGKAERETKFTVCLHHCLCGKDG